MYRITGVDGGLARPERLPAGRQVFLSPPLTDYPQDQGPIQPHTPTQSASWDGAEINGAAGFSENTAESAQELCNCPLIGLG